MLRRLLLTGSTTLSRGIPPSAPSYLIEGVDETSSFAAPDRSGCAIIGRINCDEVSDLGHLKSERGASKLKAITYKPLAVGR
jgi:hypothetical protein